MKNFKIFSFLFSICFLGSCVINPASEEVVIPPVPEKLVISSFTLAPFGSVVAITKTFDALVAKDTLNYDSSALLSKILVSEADVKISYNNKTVVLNEIIPGIYGSVDLEYIDGTEYRLDVLEPMSGLKVTAITKLLKSAKIENLKNLINQVDSLYSFEIDWNDDPTNENYYLITSKKFTVSSDIFSNIDNSILNLFSLPYYLAKEEEKVGNSFKYSPLISPYAESDTIVVTLSNITKENFEFLNAYRKRGSILNSLLAEPIRTLPSNINGGYGFFAINYSDFRTIVLK